MKIFKKTKLWHRILFGLFMGIAAGFFLEEKAPIYFDFIGDFFIKLIKMIITPLIFFSIVVGITSIDDGEALSRIATKSMLAFVCTTCFAILIGLCVANIVQPGKSFSLILSTLSDVKTTKTTFSVARVLQDAVPDNALDALVSGKMLQIVFFAFFTGIVLNKIGSDKKPITKAFQLIANLVFKMIHIILEFAPYGAFALTASVVGKQGISVLQSLGWLVLAFILAVFIQYIIFGVMISIFARVTPWQFYKKSVEYQALAFSTSSSKASLPIAMDVCANKIGMSKNSTSFVLPLGSSINMDGMAIYLGICTVFFAQAYNVQLTFIDYLVIIFTSTIGSIGAAGVPSGTLLMLPVVLGSINLPIEGISLLVGIDRLLDMIRTTINITGDATIALIVDATENTLNKEIYYTDSDKLPDSIAEVFE